MENIDGHTDQRASKIEMRLTKVQDDAAPYGEVNCPVRETFLKYSGHGC